MKTATRMSWVGLGIVGLAACTSVAPIPSPWATYIATNQPTTVWLTRNNHTVVRVDGPRVFGDTVVGAVQGQYAEIPLSDVMRIAAIRADKTKTIMAATAGGVATVAALVIIFRGSGGSQTAPTCDPDCAPQCC